jgi:hypothetical protein
MRYVHGAAFCDEQRGALNVIGLRYGKDPNEQSLLDHPAFVTEESIRPIEMSKDAFVVEQDTAGHGHDRSGLLTFLEAIGNVAVTDIYPSQFAMTNAIFPPIRRRIAIVCNSVASSHQSLISHISSSGCSQCNTVG